MFTCFMRILQMGFMYLVWRFKIIFIAYEQRNKSSPQANAIVSLIKIDGHQSTYTEIFHLLKLKDSNITNEQPKPEKVNKTKTSFTSEFLDLFNLLSSDLDYLYSASPIQNSYDLSNLLNMKILDKVAIEGQNIVQSFADVDNVYCFIHSTHDQTVLTYYDMSNFTMKKYSSYTFPDNSQITSLTCGKGFVVYSRKFDQYKLRVLNLDVTKNKWEEKCHSDLREGVYESLYLSYYKNNDTYAIMNSIIKKSNDTHFVAFEISSHFEYSNAT